METVTPGVATSSQKTVVQFGLAKIASPTSLPTLRWFHFLAGITWIGLLYYFNFVQGEFFKETDANTKSAAVQKLVPRALWWFRWGAMFTFLTGFAILMMRAHSAGMELLTDTS